MDKQSIPQAIPVLVVREQGFLTMSFDRAGQTWMTECDTREQGINELAEASGLPVSAFYLTEAE